MNNPLSIEMNNKQCVIITREEYNSFKKAYTSSERNKQKSTKRNNKLKYNKLSQKSINDLTKEEADWCKKYLEDQKIKDFSDED